MTSPTQNLIATIEVVGEPQGQPRPRARARPLSSGKHAAQVYSRTTIGKGKKRRTHPIVFWRQAVYDTCVRRRLIDHATRIQLLFRIRRPKTHWGTGRNTGRLKATSPRNHVSTPDIDNLVKPVFDAMSSADFLANDSLVVRVDASKRYCKFQEVPGCTITIWELNDA
jgi:Holliday junction resolvase RusA-like endonuclease